MEVRLSSYIMVEDGGSKIEFILCYCRKDNMLRESNLKTRRSARFARAMIRDCFRDVPGARICARVDLGSIKRGRETEHEIAF